MRIVIERIVQEIERSIEGCNAFIHIFTQYKKLPPWFLCELRFSCTSCESPRHKLTFLRQTLHEHLDRLRDIFFFSCVCVCRKINKNYTLVGIITVIVIVRHKILSPQNLIAVTFNIGMPCSTQKASTNVCWMWNVTSWLGTEAGRIQTITHSGLLEKPRTIHSHLSSNIWKNQE